MSRPTPAEVDRAERNAAALLLFGQDPQRVRDALVELDAARRELMPKRPRPNPGRPPRPRLPRRGKKWADHVRWHLNRGLNVPDCDHCKARTAA